MQNFSYENFLFRVCQELDTAGHCGYVILREPYDVDADGANRSVLHSSHHTLHPPITGELYISIVYY